MGEVNGLCGGKHNRVDIVGGAGAVDVAAEMAEEAQGHPSLGDRGAREGHNRVQGA